MSDYVIKSYDESFLKKQVEIGTIYSKKWLTFTQSNVEKLRQIYSQDNFDSDTRLYCFKDKEMVGYISATIIIDEEKNTKRANTRLAFVLPGHEKMFYTLYSQLEEILKEKGVSVITTTQSKMNDNYYELAEKIGFIYEKTNVEIFIGSSNSFKEFESDLPISDFNREINYNLALKKLKETYKNSTEEALTNYLNLTTTTHKPISFRVMKDGDKIVAFCRTRVSSTDRFAQIDLLLSEGSEFRKQIISDAMVICKNKGYEEVAVRLSIHDQNDIENAKDFVSVGFEKITMEDRLVKKL
ncbi:MAG: GNAT family N-acetyltransferase [Asgard group archaeon]|nr:GNAT family N-acetyltransferase [Asgard group archaeon]